MDDVQELSYTFLRNGDDSTEADDEEATEVNEISEEVKNFGDSLAKRLLEGLHCAHIWTTTGDHTTLQASRLPNSGA